VCLISFQDSPIIFVSSITGLLLATFGLPRPRLPCGFQSRASRAITLDGLRRVWPSHPHIRRRISKWILLWLVLVHRLFDIRTGQNVRKILRSHLLLKTCNYIVLVVLAFHVSQPCKRTDFTLELNRRRFVRVEYALEFQILCHTCFLYSGRSVSYFWLYSYLICS
jgi:hypothetical protein